jgi:O-antigen/teichoic acid export membrane protein
MYHRTPHHKRRLNLKLITPSTTVRGLYAKILRRETTRQTGMLVTAQTGAMFFGLCASLIQARWMDPAEMGRFAFCLSIIVVSGLFFEFGVSSAGARVLALAQDNSSERQALGALVLITTGLGLAFSLFVAAFATPVDMIFGKEVRNLLLAAAPLAFFQPFQQLIELSCQGLNQIRRLSEFQLLMAGTYLLALAVLTSMHRLSAGAALGAYLAGTAVASLWTISRLRPAFKGGSRYVKQTLSETRGYGFNLYLARISGFASSRADQLAIGYFLPDTAPLGMYAIAQKFSNPIVMLGRSLAMTRYRSFARLAEVPGKILRWNVIIVSSASIALVLLGPVVLRLVFPRYAAAAPLILPFALMNLFVGLFQPYNIFLGSHGRGTDLRNIVLIVAFATIAALALFVPRFGVAGAAWTVAAAMALDYLLHVYYYRKSRRELTTEGFLRSAEQINTSNDAIRPK